MEAYLRVIFCRHKSLALETFPAVSR
jgi:hypothetical protein